MLIMIPKIKTKKFPLTSKGQDKANAFLDTLSPYCLVSENYSTFDQKIIIKYYG